MKLRCEKSELQAACMTAAKAAAAKSPIPALEGLKLDLIGSRLRITGYDLRKAIVAEVEAECDEPGSIVVDTRFFCEMLRRMPDGKLSLTAGKDLAISAKCGRSQYNFVGMDSEEYPDLPEVGSFNKLTLPQKTLKNMIGMTLFAIADNDVRPIYTGTLFEIENGSLTLVSVDGFRLAKRTETVENCEIENCSFVVPGYSLSDIEKICGDDEEKTVSISIGQKQIVFAFDTITVMTRRLEGDFMNYRKAIPESFRYEIRVNRSDLMSTIERVALIVSEKNMCPVRMTFRDGKINCLCVNPVGKAEDVCSCSGDAEGLEIGFNNRYIMDAVKTAAVDELKLCLNTSSSPCVILAADGSSEFTFMVLPVRLHAGE